VEHKTPDPESVKECRMRVKSSPAVQHADKEKRVRSGGEKICRQPSGALIWLITEEFVWLEMKPASIEALALNLVEVMVQSSPPDAGSTNLIHKQHKQT
jgi:hypothetical protein